MNNLSVKDLRQRILTLDDQEAQLALQARLLAEDNEIQDASIVTGVRAGFILVLHKHLRITEESMGLRNDRELDEISDIKCLVQIMACKQALVELHQQNVDRINTLLLKDRQKR